MRRSRETIEIPDSNLVLQITDDRSRTLVFRDSGVAFHSASGAAAETQHVYLLNSGVVSRLEGGFPTKVLEIGLGTALGMLMTLDSALQTGTPLIYDVTEKSILPSSVMRLLELDRQIQQDGLLESFLDWRESLGAEVGVGTHRWSVSSNCSVILRCGDAREIHYPSDASFNAIYFDPFAPSENPDLWQLEFLKKMRATLADDGRLVTYCVSREVRTQFEAAGFSVRRVKGPPGGKREVLIATRAVVE